MLMSRRQSVELQAGHTETWEGWSVGDRGLNRRLDTQRQRRMLCRGKVCPGETVQVTVRASEHAVTHRGDQVVFSEPIAAAVHQGHLSKWPAYHRDLERFNSDCGRRPFPRRQQHGLHP